MKRTALRYAANLGLALISIVSVVVLTEIVLRFTSFKNLLPIIQLQPLRSYLKADPTNGYDILKNAAPTPAFVSGIKYKIWSNELGCFDTPYGGEKDSVLLVGDSFTFAFAPFSDKWGTKIQDLLGHRVLKCGVGGYGTKQELLKAASVISKMEHPPKLIVVGYFINDLEDDYLFPNSTIIDGYPVRTRKIKDMETGQISVRRKAELEEDKVYGVKEYPGNLLLKKLKWWAERESILYHMTKYFLRPALLNVPVIRNLLLKAKVITPPTIAFYDKPWLNNAWAKHFSNLRAFKTLADSHGAGLLVVIIPYKEQVYPFLTRWNGIDPERPQRILDTFFEKEGVNHIDTLPLLKMYANQTRHMLVPEKDLYWRNDPHLSIKGNHLLALLVARYIMENNLLSVDNKEKKLASVREILNNFK